VDLVAPWDSETHDITFSTVSSWPGPVNVHCDWVNVGKVSDADAAHLGTSSLQLVCRWRPQLRISRLLLALFKSKLDTIYCAPSTPPASPALIGGPRTYETVQFPVDKGRRMVARLACAHHPFPSPFLRVQFLARRPTEKYTVCACVSAVEQSSAGGRGRGKKGTGTVLRGGISV
jgi:hypothetical protein